MLHSLNYYVAVSAQFLKTKEPVLKFATISWLVVIRRKDLGAKSPFFSLFDLLSYRHQSVVSHAAVFQKRNECSVLSKGPVSSKHLP